MDALSRRRFLAGTLGSLGLVAAGCVEGARTTEWSMFRASGDNRASTREDPGPTLLEGWSIPFDELFQTEGAPARIASPVGDSDTAYLAGRFTLGGDEPVLAVASIDLADGGVNWTRQLVTADPVDPEGLAHPPVLWEDYVLAVGGTEATVLDREDGATVFSIALGFEPTTVPGGDRALVALASGDSVAMLDLDEDEDVRWTYETASEVPPVTPLTVLDDSIYIPADDTLTRLRRGDGELLWTRALGGEGVTTAAPLVDGYNMHLRLRDADGAEELVALARNDLSEHWRRPLGMDPDLPQTLLAYRAGLLYVLADGTLEGVRVGDAETDAVVDVGVDAPYPTVGGDHVYLLGDEELVIVDRTEGAVTHRTELPGGAGPAPQEALPRDKALVVTRDDRVLGLQPPPPPD